MLGPAHRIVLGERIDARGPYVRVGRKIEIGVEERVRIAQLVPAERVVMGIRIDMRIPHVVVLRIVIEIVDQRIPVVIVHGAVGEVEHLEARQHGMAARRVDDHLVAGIGHSCIDQPEAERDRVRP